MSFEITTKSFKDNLTERAINVILIIAWGFLLLWIAANVRGAETWGIVLIFYIMLGMYSFGYIMDFLRDHFGLEKYIPVAVIGVKGLLTKSVLISSIAITVASWLGYFLVAIKMGVTIPLSAGFEQDVALDVVYKAVNSPLGEEFFFRALLIPTLAVLLALGIKKALGIELKFVYTLLASVFIAALAFAATHYFAYAADMALMGVSFVWGVVAGALLIMFGILIVIAFHAGNNLPLTIGKEAAFITLFAITVAIAVFNAWIAMRFGVKKWVKGG